METKVESKQRKEYLDLLRITACFMVVVIHIIYKEMYLLPISSTPWKRLNTIDAFMRCAVPIYFMISGALFLNKETISLKELWTKKIAKLCIIYFIAYLVYFLLRIEKFHMWFIPELIGIYIILPFINAIVKYENGKYVNYLIGLFLTFGILRETVLLLPYFSDTIKSYISVIPVDLCGYVGYFVLGYKLDRHKTSKNKFIFLFVYIITVLITA